MIILLDLNYTLVSNSHQKLKPFVRQIEKETYSFDLLNRIIGKTVILITARPVMHKDATLQSIKAKMKWQPEDAYFNEWMRPPPSCKKKILETYIFPKHGANPESYVAIESNPSTRAMYEKQGIVALTRDTVLETFRSKD
ncbi:MAG TPA: hypothetical protein DD400_03960 [Rhodospirillaceae bacterium]|nr:hypothetical protein [Rhodospirillaceae bacterium]